MSDEIDPLSFLIGPAFVFGCEVEESDHIEVRRVGIPGVKGAAVAVTSVVDEADFDVSNSPDGQDAAFTSTVVLSTTDTRKLIAVLLSLVDECDGVFTSVLPWDEEEK